MKSTHIKRITLFLFVSVFIVSVYHCASDNTKDNENLNKDTLTKKDTSQNKIPETTDDDNIKILKPKDVSGKDKPPETYQMPKELVYTPQHDKTLYHKFYPIGWSREGKFAYISEPADEACGCYFFKIVIQDMITDDKVWEWKYNDNGAGDDMKTVWWKNLRTFNEKLHENKIIQLQDIEIGPPVFQYDNRKYYIDLDTKLREDPDYGFDVMQRAIINIRSPQLGKKTIYNYYERKYAMVLNTMLIGHIKNPYEDRVCIIHTEERRGYEGPPNVVYFKLSGCDLVEGYEK